MNCKNPSNVVILCIKNADLDIADVEKNPNLRARFLSLIDAE
jgi:hypothetical protein